MTKYRIRRMVHRDPMWRVELQSDEGHWTFVTTSSSAEQAVKVIQAYKDWEIKQEANRILQEQYDKEAIYL